MLDNFKTKKWIENVIKSCQTWEQLTTCEKLINNFKIQMEKNGYDRMLALPYISDLEYKIFTTRKNLLNNSLGILN
jgi:hypothetical protein